MLHLGCPLKNAMVVFDDCFHFGTQFPKNKQKIQLGSPKKWFLCEHLTAEIKIIKKKKKIKLCIVTKLCSRVDGAQECEELNKCLQMALVTPSSDFLHGSGWGGRDRKIWKKVITVENSATRESRLHLHAEVRLGRITNSKCTTLSYRGLSCRDGTCAELHPPGLRHWWALPRSERSSWRAPGPFSPVPILQHAGPAPHAPEPSVSPAQPVNTNHNSHLIRLYVICIKYVHVTVVILTSEPHVS